MNQEIVFFFCLEIKPRVSEYIKSLRLSCPLFQGKLNLPIEALGRKYLTFSFMNPSFMLDGGRERILRPLC